MKNNILRALATVAVATLATAAYAQTVTETVAPGLTATTFNGRTVSSGDALFSDHTQRGSWVLGTEIVLIGPFTGDKSEPFNERVVFLPCIPGRIFDNTADMCTPNASGTHTTGCWGFACTICARSSPLFYGSAGGYTEITFDKPVALFGGYFGTNAPGSTGGNAIFFDADDNLLANLRIKTGPVESCTWNWNGWRVTGEPIKRVELRNEVFGGAFLNMDDMEASVPRETCDPCDMNCDGVIDNEDIEPFIDLLFGPNPDPCDTCTGDTNGDGSVNAEDIEGFINCLVP